MPVPNEATLSYKTKSSCELSPIIVFADFEVFSQPAPQLAAVDGTMIMVGNFSSSILVDEWFPAFPANPSFYMQTAVLRSPLQVKLVLAAPLSVVFFQLDEGSEKLQGHGAFALVLLSVLDRIHSLCSAGGS